MYNIYTKTIIISTLVCLYALNIYADTPKTAAEQFQSGCLTNWMKRPGHKGDKTDYKNFGIKHCQCCVNQFLANPNAVAKDIEKKCVTQTILHDALEILQSQQDLLTVSENQIISTCQNRWHLVFPKVNNKTPKVYDFCQCAASKLTELVNRKASLSAQDYDQQVNDIASACTPLVEIQQK